MSGFIHMLANFAGILEPSITGYMVEASGSFTGAFVLAGGVAIVGALSVTVFVRRGDRRGRQEPPQPPWEQNVQRAGGHIHWASTADDARAAVLEICRKASARTVTKGKSMIFEELGINDHLEKQGIEPVETDLGEYILRIRKKPPSHIIGPAFHLDREDWEESFRKVHTHLPADRVLIERQDIMTEARQLLREKFLAADVGITGANFLVAETGSSVIVTNEGNGD